MSDRAPTLQVAINIAVEMGLRNLHTMIPAKVVKIDGTKVNCQILVKQVTEDESGEREVSSWPIVPGVPVAFMGAGDFRMTVPVSNGTTGMLLFSHRSLDKWLSGTGAEVDPEFDHDHALTDAVFVPGLKAFGSTWQDLPSSGMSIGKDSGLQITITDSVITAAENAVNARFVALSNLVDDRLATIAGTFDSHVHDVTAAPGTTDAATPPIGALASVAASKFKAE